MPYKNKKPNLAGWVFDFLVLMAGIELATY